ncbi:MAG: hypothetical protein ABI680_05160 [Chthoniobacteraceae bacterium]
MKHAAALMLIFVFLTAGCEKPNFLKTAAELATPTPAPTPKPKPTPKPGSWMWEKHQNSLDQPPKK